MHISYRSSCGSLAGAQDSRRVNNWRYSCRHSIPPPITYQTNLQSKTVTFTHRIHIDVVESTNDVARELLRDTSTVVVSAHHQTRGRGRSGRVWEDEYGKSALISFGMRHDRERTTEDIAADMARGTLAVMDVIGSYLPSGTYRCKYPNDVQVQENGNWCKLAGTLVEHEFIGSKCTTTVIGIGVNVLQHSFPETITQPCTSLTRLKLPLQPTDVIDGMIDSMQRLTDMPAEAIYRIWSSAVGVGRVRLSLVGEGGSWRASEIRNDGRLKIINTIDATTRIIDDGDRIRYID